MQYLHKTDYGNVTSIVIPNYQCVCVIGSVGNFLLSSCLLLLSHRFKIQLHECRPVFIKIFEVRAHKNNCITFRCTHHVICLFNDIFSGSCYVAWNDRMVVNNEREEAEEGATA
jgi:hypothetical protein